jgi:hypothetical protein
MDPISLILTALAAGASTALKDTAGSAIKDGYAALKALVRRRFANAPAADRALQAVESETEPAPAVLKQTLEDTGADRDEELLRAARTLLEQIDPAGAKAGKYNVTISGGKGAVVGDNASVTMNFND